MMGEYNKFSFDSQSEIQLSQFIEVSNGIISKIQKLDYVSRYVYLTNNFRDYESLSLIESGLTNESIKEALGRRFICCLEDLVENPNLWKDAYNVELKLAYFYKDLSQGKLILSCGKREPKRLFFELQNFPESLSKIIGDGKEYLEVGQSIGDGVHVESSYAQAIRFWDY